MSNSSLIQPFAQMYSRDGWYPLGHGRLFSLTDHGVEEGLWVPAKRDPIGYRNIVKGHDYPVTYLVEPESQSTFEHSYDDLPSGDSDGFDGKRYYWDVAGLVAGSSEDPNHPPQLYHLLMKKFNEMFPSWRADGKWSYPLWRRRGREIIQAWNSNDEEYD